MSRYSSNDWYGDSMAGKENRDSYQLFSVGGLDFILVDLEYNPGADVRSWASGILAAHPARRAIVVIHDYLNLSATRSTAGQNIWNDVVGPNCNVFLVLSGHYHPNAEVRLTSQNSCGAPVHQVLQDYQDEANGGNGWLRYYTFKPAENRIDAYTYSPTLNQSKTGPSSQFSLDYAMAGGGAFASIGTATVVASGGHATLSWPGRAADTEYEWYVKVTDGSRTTTSPTWSFTTGVPGGDEVDPVVSVPADPTVAATGAAGAVVTFSASAVDDVDGSLVPTCTPPSGSTFALGSTTVTCSANDAAGNTGSASFTVTVVDTTAPVISVPADISLPAEGPDGAHATYSASAVDLVDGSLLPTCAPASGSLFPVGTTIVTCSVSDAAGNAAAPVDFSVTVSRVDRAPVAVDGSATTAEDTATPVTLAASDPDGDALAYLVLDGPAHGTLSGTAPALSYTPAPDYAGPDILHLHGLRRDPRQQRGDRLAHRHPGRRRARLQQRRRLDPRGRRPRELGRLQRRRQRLAQLRQGERPGPRQPRARRRRQLHVHPGLRLRGPQIPSPSRPPTGPSRAPSPPGRSASSRSTTPRSSPRSGTGPSPSWPSSPSSRARPMSIPPPSPSASSVPPPAPSSTRRAAPSPGPPPRPRAPPPPPSRSGSPTASSTMSRRSASRSAR